MKVNKFTKKVFNSFLLALLCLIVTESLVFINGQMQRGPLDGLENQITDLSFKIRRANSLIRYIETDQVVIVDMDDASIEQLGRPQLWPRAYDARVMAHVGKGKPKGMGIDYLYTEPDSLSQIYTAILQERGYSDAERIIQALSTDHELIEAIDSASIVYLAMYDDDTKDTLKDISQLPSFYRLIGSKNPGRFQFGRMRHPVHPVEYFSKEAKAIGTINMPTPEDGVIRNYNLLQQIGEPDEDKTYHFIGNFPLYMILDAYEVPENEVKLNKKGLQIGDVMQIPLLSDGTFRLNWMGETQTIRYISFYKILFGLIPPEFFQDKYVFFGTSASGLEDLKTVPPTADKMPGVEVHAVALLNMINGAFLKEIDEKGAIPYLLLIGAILVFLYLTFKPLPGLALMFGMVFIEIGIFIFWLLPVQNVIFPLVSLMLVSILGYISSTIYRYFTEEKEKKKLRGAFGTYVSPAVVNQIMENADSLQLGGQKKNLSVLFSDIRGFTTISEELDPQELVAILNNYLSKMSEVIFKHEGTIDKFIGDAIVAIFGAPLEQPDHADRACRVALDMMDALRDLNIEHHQKQIPKFEVGIGLNTGDMTVGNIGSKRRFDYTVIGDMVNLGARLEGLTKFFKLEILVSEMTKNACLSGDFLFRKLAHVRVIGRDKPVIVYQLVDWAKNQDKYLPWIEIWDQAYQSYSDKDMEAALDLFKECKQLSPSDVITNYYISKCHEVLSDQNAYSLTVEMESK